MEFTKEQYAALEEVAIAFGGCIENLIRSIEELAIRFQICKVETELLEMAIENMGVAADIFPILIPAVIIYAVICGICVLLNKQTEKRINRALEDK